MTFTSYNTYLSESDNNSVYISRKDTVKNEYGFIDYYYEVSDKYPNGLVVDMGGHVDMRHRGKGIFKELLKDLFSLFPEGTTIQLSVLNHKLVHLFRRIGFKKVKEIEYWGKTPYAMEGILTDEMKNLI